MDWHRIFFSEQKTSFFLEILLRTPIMFLVTLAVLRFTGKRGGQQLSIFEVVMIITLGSAAGDAMFYQEVGLLHAIAVFAIVFIMYRIVIFIIIRNDKAEIILEGGPVYIIRNGLLCLKEMNGDEMGTDEFFAEFRVLNVSHLGQVNCAILEANGKISIFFRLDSEVVPGLPILPDQLAGFIQIIDKKGVYSCISCGFTKELFPQPETLCEICRSDKWVLSKADRRIV